jgi:phosphoenolpyruvate carboxykinase (ATP)
MAENRGLPFPLSDALTIRTGQPLQLRGTTVATTLSAHDLTRHGFNPKGRVYWNEPPARLIEQAVHRNEGLLTAHGAFVGITTPHTGRSPNDKFVVRESGTEGEVWWGNVNVAFDGDRFTALRQQVLDHLSAQELFARDVWAGTDPKYRIGVRVVSPNAWH